MTKTPEAIMQNWYKTKLGSREMICDEVVLDIIKAAMNAKMPSSDRFIDIARDLESEIQDLRNQLAKKDEMLRVAKLYLDLIKDNDLHGGVNQFRNAWELVDECLEKLE